MIEVASFLGQTNSSGSLSGAPLAPLLPQPVRQVLKRVLSPIGMAPDNGDGFPAHAAAAEAVGRDVNDWIESELGWVPALPVLESLVFPILTPSSVVCEVGVGTGRWSRHILDRIPEGRLLMIDRSPWIVKFLSRYFASSLNARAVLCSGAATLPFEQSGWANLFFSQGLFITMKLGHVALYLREFSRGLETGGHAVFDFIDPSTSEGWAFLERESPRAFDVFTYHSADAIARCCNSAGLDVVRSEQIGKSTYVVARKTG